MHIIISAAISIDGYLDDASDERLMLSSPEDFKAVHELRSSCDAVLIGAETLRRDNPSLTARHNPEAKQPKKIVLTRSGDLPADSRFFTEGNAEKIILMPDIALAPDHLPAQTVQCGVKIDDIVKTLEDIGIKRLMIEGGAQIQRLFIQSGQINELRLSISPRIVADDTCPRFPIKDAFTARCAPVKQEMLGDNYVTWYRYD